MDPKKPFVMTSLSSRLRSDVPQNVMAIRRYNPTLLIGEEIQGVAHKVIYLCPYEGQRNGWLSLTNYSIFFKCFDRNAPMVIELPLGVIYRVEHFSWPVSNEGISSGYDIICKDMRNMRFGYIEENSTGQSFFEKLKEFAFPLSHGTSLFAFEYAEKFPEDGWNVYNPWVEFNRMGIPIDTWCLTKLNQNYKLCDTYPAILAVPARATEDIITNSSFFRSKGRLPVLSWFHSESGATITRASQPMVGVHEKRCHDDECYIQFIIDANASSHKLYILDARASYDAVAYKSEGGGYELQDRYQNAQMMFLNVPDFHLMRHSMQQLKDICFPNINEPRWTKSSSIDSTFWLNIIKNILSGAFDIASIIENLKSSVLVHGSDGWDRTALLTALAMLILDPYYRTIIGFEVLIEKEWIGFGHKFQSRIGHGDDNYIDVERSPVFLLFIDCVWQVTCLFPYAFEFNELFLITIIDHLYSCKFGTFLFNSEKERLQNELKQKTVSLWSYINSEKQKNSNLYRNELYSPQPNALLPVETLGHIQFWKRLHCQWNPKITQQLSTQLLTNRLHQMNV